MRTRTWAWLVAVGVLTATATALEPPDPPELPPPSDLPAVLAVPDMPDLPVPAKPPARPEPPAAPAKPPAKTEEPVEPPVEPAVETPPAAPAQPLSVANPDADGELLPDPLRTLNLTTLQRRVLTQLFCRYAFETPARPGDGAPLIVTVEPDAPGGLYRLGPAGDLPVRLTVTIAATRKVAAVRVRYVAQNFYGSKVAEGEMPAVLPDVSGLARADIVLKELDAFGYYHVLVTASSDEGSVTASSGVVVVHAFEEGPDAKSPFGLAAPPGPMPAALPEICRRLGVRHLAVDWAAGGAAFDALVRAGVVPLPVARFDIPQTDPAPAVVLGTLGEAIQRTADALPHWLLGGRPEFRGDLAASAVSYREMVSGLVTGVRGNQVPAILWVAASPDILADVLTEGPVMAGVDGVCLYTDAGAAAPHMRSGAFRRSLDYGVQVARRMGVKRAVVVTGDDPASWEPQRQAWKLVTRHVLALAAGAERVFVAWDRGLPRPLPSAAAYAWMAHLLDGATYDGPVWDAVPLVEAHLFTGLARRAAVVWSLAGNDPGEPDRGALVFDDGLGLEAMDVVGHPVGIWKGRRLIVPFGEAPVYIVSGELKAAEIRDRLRKARMLGVVPASVYIENLIRGDVPGRASVTLWVQSHRPAKQEAIAGLLLPEGWRARQTKRAFPLEAGQAREVTFECDMPPEAEVGAGPFPIEAVLSLDEQYARRRQDVWPAQAPQRTITVGYGLRDWGGIAPVILENKAGDIWAEVRAAWDKEFFYFSAAVRRQRATFRGGPFDFDGDAIQLAWGLAPRADDDFGHPARDLALPAGAFRDTDHLMALTFGADGAHVVRLRGPHVALRAHVPGNLDAWYGPVAGAVADISRDEAIGYTLYEAAIPMKELAPLKGERGRAFRFGFRIGQGGGRPLEWSRVAGVPDFLTNPASYLPASDADSLPCQTWWGMVGPRPGAPPPEPEGEDEPEAEAK